MLPDIITLHHQGGEGGTMAFNRVLTPQGSNGIHRVFLGSVLGESMEFVLLRTPAAKLGQLDRNLVSFRQTELDSKGAPQTMTLNFTAQVPRSDAFSKVQVCSLTDRLINFLCQFSETTQAVENGNTGVNTYFGRFLSGEA